MLGFSNFVYALLMKNWLTPYFFVLSLSNLVNCESLLSELCPFSTLAFSIDKRIVRGIVFYKHISSSHLFTLKYCYSSLCIGQAHVK